MPINIDALVGELIEREGGYVNHPADRGGPTCWGITEAQARAAGYSGAMRDFPRSTAAALYRECYWDRPGFSKVAFVAARLAEELFDTGVNCGPATAARFLQRALNAMNRQGKDYADIPVDGRIGPSTLATLQRYLTLRPNNGEAILLRSCDVLQGAHYFNLAERDPSQEAFLFGWIANRVGNVA